MELKNGRITILFNNTGLEINVIDFNGPGEFVRVTLNPKQAVQALSRMSHTKCKVVVGCLDNVGKKMEYKGFEFPMSGHFDYRTREEVAIKLSKEKCPEGWESDCYFGSQDSFFFKNHDDEPWARTTIRRYV